MTRFFIKNKMSLGVIFIMLFLFIFAACLQVGYANEDDQSAPPPAVEGPPVIEPEPGVSGDAVYELMQVLTNCLDRVNAQFADFIEACSWDNILRPTSEYMACLNSNPAYVQATEACQQEYKKAEEEYLNNLQGLPAIPPEEPPEEPKCFDLDGTDFVSGYYAENIPGYTQMGDHTERDWCMIGDRTLIEYGCFNDAIVSKSIRCDKLGYDECTGGACGRSLDDDPDEPKNTDDEDDDEKPEEDEDNFTTITFDSLIQNDKPVVILEPHPIISGLDIRPFTQDGKTDIAVYVYNGGTASGQFSAMLINCFPFVQSAIPFTLLLPDETSEMIIPISLTDTSKKISLTCDVIVRDIGDSNIYTSQNIVLEYDPADYLTYGCQSDEDCEENEFCDLENNVCVEENICQPVITHAGAQYNVIFLGDDYASDELLEQDIHYIVDAGEDSSRHSLFTTQPFNEFRESFNIYMARSPEPLPGVSNGEYTDVNAAAAAELLSSCSVAGHPIILSHKNFRSYAFFFGRIHMSLTYTARSLWGALLLHEFGHAFAGLADEYVEPTDADTPWANLDRPGWPNCADNEAQAHVWWDALGIPDMDTYSPGCSYVDNNFRAVDMGLMQSLGNHLDYGALNQWALGLRLTDPAEYFSRHRLNN